MDEKITIDLEKIKETFELKEGCKYIIQVENMTQEDMAKLGIITNKFNIEAAIINQPIKIYEIKNE